VSALSVVFSISDRQPVPVRTERSSTSCGNWVTASRAPSSPPAAVDQLRAIGTVAAGLLDAVIAYLDDENAWAAERLMGEPGWVLDAALTHSGNGKVFAA
jgi:hypothetical protein